MKVTFTLPTDGVDATIKAFDADGKLVKVARLEIEPIFYQSTAQANILFGGVKLEKGTHEEDGQRFMLAVGGATGICKLLNRTQVKAKVEQAADGPAASENDSGDSGKSKASATMDRTAPADIELPDAP